MFSQFKPTQLNPLRSAISVKKAESLSFSIVVSVLKVSSNSDLNMTIQDAILCIKYFSLTQSPNDTPCVHISVVSCEKIKTISSYFDTNRKLCVV